MRLVKCVTADGQIRVVATNLPASEFPAALFGDLYHQRWRIEEAFKRLKHRAKLECVSGLTQHALLVDVHAKVLADNLASLLCLGAADQIELNAKQRVCNRSYAAACLARFLPRMVLALQGASTFVQQAFKLLGVNSLRRVPGRRQPRPKYHVKPHPHLAYKG